MNGPRNAMATLTLAMLMFSQSASAGILNYHRNFGLACAEPGYRPALDVRINSVALADAIRDMTGAVLELTRSEEHWSLSLLQGLDQEAEQQRYTMLIAANKALSGSVEASTRLARVTLLQKEIMSDAATTSYPGVALKCSVPWQKQRQGWRPMILTPALINSWMITRPGCLW